VEAGAVAVEPGLVSARLRASWTLSPPATSRVLLTGSLPSIEAEILRRPALTIWAPEKGVLPMTVSSMLTSAPATLVVMVT